MHWLDMSSIARQYIHISYTDVLGNIFRVTNFTLNIYILFLFTHHHYYSPQTTSTSHWAHSASGRVSETIPSLSMCAFHFVHRIAIRVWFEQEIWHSSWFLFFLNFFSFQKWQRFKRTDKNGSCINGRDHTAQRRRQVYAKI